MAALRRLAAADLPRLRQFWIQHWGGEEMILRGEVFRPEQLSGFVTQDWDGVVTYYIKGDECEIMSLDSLRPDRGIGTALLADVVNEARQRGCRRIAVTTTNDNLCALGFYQKRGFELVKVNRGAVNESRKMKPSISLIGENGIPLRDEIELEMKL